MSIPQNQQLGHIWLIIVTLLMPIMIIDLYLVNNNYPFPA